MAIFDSPRDGVRLPLGVWAGRGRPIPGLDVEGVGSLGLPVEDGLGGNLAGLGVDAEVVRALGVLHDVVVHLSSSRGAIDMGFI